jgi:hypothetical protein
MVKILISNCDINPSDAFTGVYFKELAQYSKKMSVFWETASFGEFLLWGRFC